MTLAVNTTPASLLPLDLYDNPDTPGTTYSFQAATPKPLTQVDATRLTTSTMDIQTFPVTDDEMIDSDTEARRDEDFDLDIEVTDMYSTTPLELDNMEEDILVEGRPESGTDHDDIMIDDDLNFLEDDSAAIEVTIGEVGANSPQEESGSYNTTTLPSPAVIQEQPLKSNLQSPSAADHIDPLNSEITKPEIAHDSPEFAREADGNEDEAPKNPLEDSKPAVDTTWSEGTSATLGEEAPNNQQNGHDADQTQEELVQDHDDNTTHSDFQNHDLENYYPHVVVVSYDHNRVCLFPPPEVTSQDESVNPFHDLPTEFFIEDISVCHKGLDQMFEAFRGVLGDSISNDDELIIEVNPLGLRIGEDSKACESVCLQQILDVHVQLQRRDGYNAPLPVNMSLFTVPRFWKSLEFLTVAAENGKGLDETLRLLKARDVDEYNSGVDDENHELTAEETKNQPFDTQVAGDGHNQEETNQSDLHEENNSDELFTEQPSEQGQYNIPAPDDTVAAQAKESVDEEAVGKSNASAVQSPPSDHRNSSASKSPNGSQRHTASPGKTNEVSSKEVQNEGESSKDASITSKDTVPVTKTSVEVVEEEELLEYEDDEPDFAQKDTDHRSPADVPHQTFEENLENPATNDEFKETGNHSKEVATKQELNPHEKVNNSEAHIRTTDPEDRDETDDKAEDDKTSSIPVFGGDDEEGEYDGTEEQYDSYDYGDNNEQYQQEGYEEAEYTGDDNFPLDDEAQNNASATNVVQDENNGYSQQSFEGEAYLTTEDQYTQDAEYAVEDHYDNGYEDQDANTFEGDFLASGDGYDQGEFALDEESHYTVQTGNSDANENSEQALYTTTAAEMSKTATEGLLDDEELIEYADELFEQDVPQISSPGSNLSPGLHKRLRDDDANLDGDGEGGENQAVKRVRSD